MSESLEEDDAIVVEEGEIIPDLEGLGISSGQEDEDSTSSISEEIQGSEIQKSAMFPSHSNILTFPKPKSEEALYIYI